MANDKQVKINGKLYEFESVKLSVNGIDIPLSAQWYYRTPYQPVQEPQPAPPVSGPDRSRFPHVCARCGAPAYMGAVPAAFECSNKECKS